MVRNTDMAEEAYRLWRSQAEDTTQLPGVTAREETVNGCRVMRVEILDQRGVDALCKPIGSYITLSMPIECDSYTGQVQDWCRLAALEIRDLMGRRESVLVVGLGNRAITPDAIGPGAADQVIATRHLRREEKFQGFGNVSVLRPGVLGDTGLESAELVKAAAQAVEADCILAMDALAAAEPERLCCSLQLSDTGIVPGSGVGNHRSAITRETVGVPVIAIGVPTVINASAFSGGTSHDYEGLFVSPRDMDLRSKRISRLMGMSVNCAVHSGVDASFLWELSGM